MCQQAGRLRNETRTSHWLVATYKVEKQLGVLDIKILLALHKANQVVLHCGFVLASHLRSGDNEEEMGAIE